MQELTDLLNQLSNWLYAPYALPVLLVFAGGYLSYQTGLVQVLKFPAAVKTALSGMFGGGGKGEGTITSFQALSSQSRSSSAKFQASSST